MNQSDTVNEKENKVAIIGPGDLLQAARIEQGLTTHDVATRMHLSLGVLQSIEENNFDDITAPIFVKGYLRSYARLVSLNEDEIIRLYVDLYSNEDPPICAVSQILPESKVHNARIKWATYLVIFVLIALLSAWGWNKIQNKPEAVSLDVNQPNDVATTEPVAAETEVIEIQVGSEQSAVDRSNDSADVYQPDDAAATEQAAAEIEVIEILAESEQSSVDGSNEFEDESSLVSQLEQVQIADTVDITVVDNIAEPALDEVVVVEAEPIKVLANGTEPEVSSDIAAAEATATEVEKTNMTTDTPFDISREAPSGIDLINIMVNADTWADIKDANDHRLVYDLLRANLNVQIRGKAPFNAFFGNGHGVKILFNSQSIDIANYTLDDNTARFKIGTN